MGFKRKGFRDRLRWASRDILGVCILCVYVMCVFEGVVVVLFERKDEESDLIWSGVECVEGELRDVSCVYMYTSA